jgi:hypothetical protein
MQKLKIVKNSTKKPCHFYNNSKVATYRHVLFEKAVEMSPQEPEIVANYLLDLWSQGLLYDQDVCRRFQEYLPSKIANALSLAFTIAIGLPVSN